MRFFNIIQQVKLVREKMNRALEIWKDLPGLSEGLSSPNGNVNYFLFLVSDFFCIHIFCPSLTSLWSSTLVHMLTA